MSKLEEWEEIDTREVLVGFEKIYDQLSGGLGHKPPPKMQTYPPYNVLKLSEDRHLIEIATAGFDREDLTVLLEKNLLKIKGYKSPVNTPKENHNSYIHKGIASREFELTYKLAEYVEVVKTEYKNGLLSISLEKIIPDSKKPRNIPIGYTKDTTNEYQLLNE